MVNQPQKLNRLRYSRSVICIVPSGFLFYRGFCSICMGWVYFISESSRSYPKVLGKVCYIQFFFRVCCFCATKNITSKLLGGYTKVTAASQTGTFPSHRCSGNRQNRGVKFYRKTFSMSQRFCEFDFQNKCEKRCKKFFYCDKKCRIAKLKFF